ncbi:MAG: hypothetical protein RI958_2570 [Actinomycetota bacterium]|jgi:hypothetical protein
MTLHDLHHSDDRAAGRESGDIRSDDLVVELVEQLSLFVRPEVPERFRLDPQTCDRGRAQIAAIRRQLEARAARRRTLDAAA